MVPNLGKTALILVAILHLSQAHNLVCYSGSTSNNKTVSCDNAGELISSGYIDISLKTYIFFHGWTQSPCSPEVAILLEVLIQLGNVNVCVLDASGVSEFGNPFYPAAVAQVAVIATDVSLGLQLLVSAGLVIGNVEFIGMSLGSHLAGAVGRCYHKTTGVKITVIISLDGAKPLYDPGPETAVCSDDATFVACLHTDWNKYGLEKTVCHVDIFVNPCTYHSTGVQLGCPPCYPILCLPLSDNDKCSHRRSIELFIQAIINPLCMPATKAGSQNDWITSGGTPNAVIYIGLNIDINARGLYYYCTSDQSPFGLGDAGMVPSGC